MKPSILPRRTLLTLIGFFSLIRVRNLEFLAITQYLTAIFLTGPDQTFRSVVLDLRFFLLVFSTTMVAGAGYIINDYYDVKIDAVNKPSRLVIDRVVRRREALLIHFLMNSLGILFAFLVSFKIGFITLLATILLWYYSNDLKRRALIGNLLVAFLTGLSLIIVAFYFGEGYKLVFFFALFSFLISVAREIIKDMEDVQGDASHGCETLPIVYGMLYAKKAVYVTLSMLIVFLFGITWWLKSQGLLIVSTILLFLLGYVVYRLYYADKKKDYTFLGNFCKVVMMVGVISMVFL